jgi:protein-disulfide isomerase
MQEEVRKLISITSWFIALQVVTFITLLGGGLFLHFDMKSATQMLASGGRGQAAPKEVKNWREYVRDHDATLGSPAAPVVIVEFTDFQCPYCSKFNESTRTELLAKYGDRIRLVFKHYPLDAIHPDAKQAAVAAQCALREQKFWEIKDVLFGNQKGLSQEFLLKSGESMGLGTAYASCMESKATLAEVEQDMKDGAEVGVQGTPTFLINGHMLAGAASMPQFEAVISKLM